MITTRQMKRLKKRSLKAFVKALYPHANIISLSEIEENQPEQAAVFREILLQENLNEAQVIFFEGSNGISAILPGEFSGKTPECLGDLPGEVSLSHNFQ